MENEEQKYPNIMTTNLGGVHYIINISQVFGDAHTFDEIIYVLGIATPEDIVTFKINSDGGNLFTLIALKNAINMSQARIRMELLGMAASAGSALFLTEAHEYVVGEDSCMMIHNMICGVGYDDTHKIVTRAEHNKKINDRFVRNTYLNFLNSDEIDSVINGKEIYLEDFEIKERLQHREELKAQQMKQEFEDSVNAEPDLSQFSVEELEEEIQLCKEDIKAYQKEVKSRTSIQTRSASQTRTSTKSSKET